MENPTTKSRARELACRVLVYCLGLFILTLGITLAVNTRMGLSAGGAFPYVLSLMTGLTFGTCFIIVYGSYVLVQWLLLGRAFGKINVLQLGVALMFGRFTDFWVWVIGDAGASSYAGRLILLLLSICVAGFGLAVYLSAELIPSPIDGLSLAVAKRLGWPFYKGKTAVDCSSSGLGIVLSLLFLGHLAGIREGTVLSAALTGKMIHLFSHVVDPVVDRLWTRKGKA